MPNAYIGLFSYSAALLSHQPNANSPTKPLFYYAPSLLIILPLGHMPCHSHMARVNLSLTRVLCYLITSHANSSMILPPFRTHAWNITKLYCYDLTTHPCKFKALGNSMYAHFMDKFTPPICADCNADSQSFLPVRL